MGPEVKPPAAGRAASEWPRQDGQGDVPWGPLLDPDGGRRGQMGLRPDLCAEGDDGGRHVRPFRQSEYPPGVKGAGYPVAVASATPQRMSRSDASTEPSPNRSSTSRSMSTPATIVGARSGWRPRTC